MVERQRAVHSPSTNLSDIQPKPISIRTLRSVEPVSTDAGSVTGECTTREQSLLKRMRGEFEEMPGLRLTLAQAARLFGVSTDTCARVLSALIDEGVLVQRANGQYQRRDATR